MKTFLILIVMMTSLNAFAGIYDKRVTKCLSGDLELVVQGKLSFFGDRVLTVSKGGVVLLEESYEEQEYRYIEKIGQYDNLQPAFGGERPALVLNLVNHGKFIVFDLGSQCKTVRQ